MFNIPFLRTVVALCSALAAAGALAQDVPAANIAPVSFSAEAKESIGVFTQVSNTLFKPAGEGPFAAVVLMPSCGGVQGSINGPLKQHAKEFLAAGHVVLVVDSFGPRSLERCVAATDASQREIFAPSTSTGVVDAYAALALLASQPFVDPARIYQVGYSWGALVSLLLASPQSAQMAGAKQRFAATVANYGGCVFKERAYVLPDVDRPFLLLMGGRDGEMPSAQCFPLLETLKAAGKPLDWHVYPDATHAWNGPSLPSRGYVHNDAVTQDATARALAVVGK